ncbi:MAG TPA: Gfo/Idh/MocA family oxidoreductase, partial [bacterium]|nr:Gfo/Idh/MocA family oxidoreductase [bacterium]
MAEQETKLTRREFLSRSSRAAAGVVAGGALATSFAHGSQVLGANDQINVAVIGINGRGMSHARAFAEKENVRVKTLVDIDERLFPDKVKQVQERQGSAPGTEVDMRRTFEDPDIDAVSIATPNHWHSLATIWACQAGKDVYVEKPGSHNVWEGRQMVEAARKYNRVVQHGTQIRSSAGIQEAIQHIRDGLLGEVYMARGLCFRWRGSIGKEPIQAPPPEVHYDLWLGPAKYEPYSENRVHYNWHWQWEYGNGDIGNQGVHQMDIARWGLGVEHPSRLTSMGGMFLWNDDKEVPNVINSSFYYPDAGEQGKMLVFDTRPWMTNDEKGAKVGVIFYGSEGYMVIDSYSHYKTYLGEDEEPGPENEAGGDHYENFLQAMRARDPNMLTAEIYEGHLSSSLCHLGLIATRLNKNLEFNPDTERFIGNEDANAMLKRD